jgi:hypothetical protein
VRGIVADARTGNPIVGAQVFLEATGQNTLTDVSGYYELGVPPGTYALFVRKVGYRTRRIPDIRVEGPTDETYAGTTVNVDLYSASGLGANRGQSSPVVADDCGTTPWAVLVEADNILRESAIGTAHVSPDSAARRYTNAHVCQLLVLRAVRYLADSSDLPTLMSDHPGAFRWEDSVWDVLRIGSVGVVHARWEQPTESVTPLVYLVLYDLAALRVLGYLSGYTGH